MLNLYLLHTWFILDECLISQATMQSLMIPWTKYCAAPFHQWGWIREDVRLHRWPLLHHHCLGCGGHHPFELHTNFHLQPRSAYLCACLSQGCKCKLGGTHGRLECTMIYYSFGYFLILLQLYDYLLLSYFMTIYYCHTVFLICFICRMLTSHTSNTYQNNMVDRGWPVSVDTFSEPRIHNRICADSCQG